MTKSRRTIAYLILVLLILLVVAIIGGLAAVLFNMELPVPTRHTPREAPAPHPLTNTVMNVTPVAELQIRIPPEHFPVEAETAQNNTGAIPTLCDGYGPQIKMRDAFWVPIIHTVDVQPTRATFTLDLGDARPTDGPNNIL
jgi:hypothetical protein